MMFDSFKICSCERLLSRCSAIACVTLLSGCSALLGGGEIDPPNPIRITRFSLDNSVAFGQGVSIANLTAFMPLPGPKALPRLSASMTPEIQNEMNRLLYSERSTVIRMLERKQQHGDAIEQIFAREGVPAELVSLAGVESHYNPLAVSPAGARGMWQFMGSTARLYGLRVTKNKDERSDPVLSTVAAAKHLKDLFIQYNDWNLVLAAYNAGPGKVAKAMTQTGMTDFWHLSRAGKFAPETRKFVPRVIALSMIMQNPAQYGLATPKVVG
jgi:hypothetical protein